MTTVVLTAAGVRPDGHAFVTFSDGNGHDFNTIAELQAWVNELDNKETTQRLCVGYLMARSPNLSNIASVKDKDFTFDMSSASPIKVQ